MVAARAKRPKTLHPYAWEVLQGREVAGPLVRLACERSYNDHKQHGREAKKRGLVFDVGAAQHINEFFPLLRHSKGRKWARQPFILSPWQEFVNWEVFGWYRLDGTRRFRSVYIEIARKNGKSTYLAGLGLYGLTLDNEPGAEVYTFATKLDQARIIHSEAIRMVKQSPALRSRLTVQKNSISWAGPMSKYEPLGSDSKTLDGLNTHFGLGDEVHAHRDGELYEVIETSQGSRDSPLMFSITTAGSDELSFCYSQRDYASQILRGVFDDDRWFGYIACLDEGDDWRDPKVWKKANPNLGVSVFEDYLEGKVQEATQNARKQNAIRRLHMNEWMRAATRFLDLEEWDACAGDLMPGELERMLVGRECYMGVDLAVTTDIAAVVAIFPPEEPGGLYDVVCRFWVPEDTIPERVARTKLPYDEWHRDGWLLATPGNVTDYEEIEAEIDVLCERYRVREIPFDPWNATATSTALEKKGANVLTIPGTYKNMSPPTKALEMLVKSQRLRHGGHPVLRWMADNLEVKEHDGALRPIKPKNAMSHKKIDGMVALIMALARAQIGEEEEEEAESVYESRGVLTFGQ